MTGYWQQTYFAKRGRSMYMLTRRDDWVCLRLISEDDLKHPLKPIFRFIY